MNRDLKILAETVVLRREFYRRGDTAEQIPPNDGQPLVDIGAAEWIAVPGGSGPLAGVDFASDRGAEVAAELGLTAADFKDWEPSGETGFTVTDVRAVRGG